MPGADVTVFGIRHHGPGSARSLRQALDALAPDALLLEGPPEGEPALPLAADPEMRPPVALLVYAPENPRRAVYFPFAIFSPEWQALTWALQHQVPARFIDLPQAYWLALEPEPPGPGDTSPAPPGVPGDAPESAAGDEQRARRDPIGWLAAAAGYSDGERWWEQLVEHRRDGRDLFPAIAEAMAALREVVGPPADPQEARLEALREAAMRRGMRAAQQEGFARIAVVCGAWHAPALADPGAASEDDSLLEGLPALQVAATWVPWTHGRLTFASGYGAGVQSPGWYRHVWSEPEALTIRWMTRVARLLRDEDLDASSAHVIEAVRLAEALAALRDRPLPGLPEMNEATQAVFCFGDALALRLIQERLIVGEALGAVPAATPAVPLQRDLEREQRRLRLPPEALERIVDLDLRKETDLARSHLLHRLALLDIAWGREEQARGARGTFHEIWRLRWFPELAVAVIAAAPWGNTLAAAGTSRARALGDEADTLPQLTALLDRVLLASLPDAIPPLMACLQAMAALAGDVPQLMDALPPLARAMRYGTVRNTDVGMVAHVVDGLVARIAIGLPGACASLNDEAAGQMFDRLLATHDAVTLLQNEEHREQWNGALRVVMEQRGAHGLAAGRCCRLLLDQGTISAAEGEKQLGLALSRAVEPAHAAAWIEGLLRGSGLMLLHDEALWRILDEWVAGLKPEVFTEVLPLLRRTFSTFAPAERRQMGERAPSGPAAIRAAITDEAFDVDRANAVLPLIGRLLGVPEANSG